MSALYTALATLATKAGFPAAAVPVAIAVAIAESSGKPNVIGDNGTSYGLWQIHLPAHPEFAGVNLLDPQTNANAAFQVWSDAGGSFTPWTTFNTGAYQAYLPAPASSPYAAPAGSMPLPLAPDAPSANSSLWAALAVGAVILFGLGYALEES